MKVHDIIILLRKKGEKSIFMNSEELKILIDSAIVANGISQRELTKLTAISRSTLNNLINGKIKKNRY